MPVEVEERHAWLFSLRSAVDDAPWTEDAAAVRRCGGGCRVSSIETNAVITSW